MLLSSHTCLGSLFLHFFTFFLKLYPYSANLNPVISPKRSKEPAFQKMIHCENIGATRKGVTCSGVFISHLQSIGPKLGLNFVWNDCIMGSLERLEFDWNGKQFPDTRKMHHGWLDHEELQGRKGTGFGVMADIGVRCKQNSTVQVKEKGSVSI